MTLSPRRNIFEITRLFSIRRFFPSASFRVSDHSSWTSCNTCNTQHRQKKVERKCQLPCSSFRQDAKKKDSNVPYCNGDQTP